MEAPAIQQPDPGEKSIPDVIDEKELLAFCQQARTRAEIVEFLAIPSEQYALRRYLDPLVQAGEIQMTMPDKLCATVFRPL